MLRLIHNLQYLATHSVGDLAVSPDRTTVVKRQEGMAPVTLKELQRIIAQTERFYQGKGRPLWIHLHKGQDGKRLGIEAGRLLHIMQGQGLKKPLPKEALETHSIVTFIINGGEIQADRELVARASPVFEKMLFGSFFETKKNKIDLNEIDSKLFQDFIAFTETEELPVINNPNDIIALYSLAEQFQAESFEKALAKRLAELLKPGELHAFISVNLRLFVQAASTIGAEKAQKVANGIHTLVKSLEQNTELEDKEALILTAKQALVAWINQAHIPINDVAAGKEPAEFFRWLGPSLRDLEYADFLNFPISNDDLDVLQHCPNLQHLNIAGCKQLKVDALDVLKHCPNLKSLNITCCTQLKADALDVLQYCPNLLSLNILCCYQLKKDALDVLQNCPNLKSLNISFCTQLNEDALNVLQHCKNLLSLDIYECTQLRKDALDVLLHCPNLQHLKIAGCKQLKVDALDVLKHCPSLLSLNISFCTQLNGDALNVLQHCKNLQSLIITHCTQLNEDALDVLLHCPNLLSLKISFCTQLKKDALDVLQHCKNLQSLDISDCDQLKKEALDVLKRCKNLQSLNISGCNQLKEDALDVLKHCKNLLSLNIAWCTQLNEDALNVLKRCKNLQSLNIVRCTQLKKDALDVLKHCPNMLSLDISYCKQLKKDALDILKHCPSLQSLNIAYIAKCNQLLKAARILRKQRPHLKVIAGYF